MLTKVCAVSENWVDGPGTEEQVLLELKIGHKVMSPKYCPQSYCARDFSIKRKLWKHFLGLFHPPTQRHLGSIGRTQVGWKYCLDFFLQSLPLIGLRVDRLDSAAACWRLRKQILFNFEFGKRQTLGLDFDYNPAIWVELMVQATRFGSDGDDLCLKHLTFVFEVHPFSSINCIAQASIKKNHRKLSRKLD